MSTVSGDMCPLALGQTSEGLGAFAGRVFTFEDKTRSGTAGPLLRRGSVGNKKSYKIVKNSATVVLRAKALCAYKTGTVQTEVDGFTRTAAAQVAGAVDELIPSGGVPVGHYFLLAVKGPSLVTTSLAADATNVFSEGTYVVAATAAASTGTTGGRAGAIDLTGATQNLGNQILNRIGVAMSARTTANTGSDLLVDLDIPY